MPPAEASRHMPVARVMVVGLAAGGLSGLFGVGGGTLIVPGLVLVLGMEQRRAHGTSLVAVIPIALSGIVGFAIDDHVDWPVALVVIAGAMVGAVIGTHWLHVVSERVLSLAFAALLVASALRLLLGDASASGRDDLSVGAIAVLLGVGLVSGTVAGLLGVGGGVIIVPTLVILLSLPTATAKGTSLAVIVPTAVVATVRNLKRDNADLRVGVVVGLSGLVSAYLAARLSVGLDDDLSNTLFAALLLFVAARMALSARTAPTTSPRA